MNSANHSTAAESSEPRPDAASLFTWDISARKFRDYLVYLVLLGLVVRVGYLEEHAHSPSFGFPTLDQRFYDAAARMLLAGEDLHQLHGLRPLLYPMFLAGAYRIGGPHGTDLALVLQHLLGVGTGVLVALIGSRLFRHRVSGLIGGAMYLLAPVPLCFEGELLVESSYTFMICLGLLLILRAAGLKGWKGGLLWLVCGAVTILAAQERPNILVFILVYPLLAAWRWWRDRQPEALWPLGGMVGAAVMAVPWGFVNQLQSDHFQVLPSAGGVNLYLGNKRTADGMSLELSRRVNYSESFEDSVEVWSREEYESAMRREGRPPANNPMAVSQYWTDRALGEIRADPAGWLRLMGKKCWLLVWNGEVPNNKAFAFHQKESNWLRWLPVRWVLLLALAPAGLWAAKRWGNLDALFILIVFGSVYVMALVAFFVCDRYRYPLWPALAVVAGGGAAAAAAAVLGRRWNWFFGMSAGAALMVLISLPNWAGVKLPSFARDYELRSLAWFDKGKFQEALVDIDQSLAQEPGEDSALHHRGNVLLALNRTEDARMDYEQTLKISADDGGVWNNYGVALDALGRTNEAMAAYRRATQCAPPSVSAFLGLAFGEVRSGQFAQATEDLDRLEKQPKPPKAVVLALRSVLTRRQGHAAQADALEKQARALDPDATTWAIGHAGGG